MMEVVDVPDYSTVVLNVSGTRFETYRRHLPSTPGHVLSNLSSASPNYRAETNDFFFDRDPAVFREVLNFYRSGEFHVPLDVCSFRTKLELQYWGIGLENFNGCCGAFYNGFCDQQSAYLRLKLDDHSTTSSDTVGKGTFRQKAWVLLTQPETSRCALVYAAVVSVVSVTLVVESILESLEQLQAPVLVERWNTTTGGNHTRGDSELEVALPALGIIELSCVVLLSIEFIVRLFFSPNKCAFLKSLSTLVDVVSLLPFYINMIITSAVPLTTGDVKIAIKVGKIFQVIRILRVLKYYSGFKLLVQTIHAGVEETILFFILVGAGTLLYSSLIHYVEPQNFPNIPTSCWWAVVTMTTVGYGDMAPKTAWGYVVGTMCAMSGLLLVAFTVPTLANNFTTLYGQKNFIQLRSQAEKENNPIFEYEDKAVTNGSAVYFTKATRL